MNKVIINGVEYAPIEKPKPLLADAQVGDLCRTRKGNYYLIKYVDTDPIRYAYERKQGDTIYVRDNGMFNMINYKHPFDIISTEPLATEGTAEWAWQMLMLGIPVSHPAEGEFQDTHYTKEGFVRCMAKTGWQLYEPANAGTPKWAWDKMIKKHKVFREINGTVFQMNACGYVIANNGEFAYNYEQFLMIEHRNDWQLYEPKPEPDYKVGDWVEISSFGDVPIQAKIDAIYESGNVWYHSPDRLSGIASNKYITRKLDRSEIKVKIGCLEGTIENAKSEGRFFIVHPDGRTNACIMFGMLDAPTRELVESLLKAQEEK